ncbi:MAG: Rho-type gtpase-activating protein [Sporothrix epigloea]
MVSDSSTVVEKSLPALPPVTPTELAPRPRPSYTRNEPSSLSVSLLPDESPEQSSTDAASSSTRRGATRENSSLTLSASNYRNNRNSSVFGGTVDLAASDSESLYIPVALEPSPDITPMSVPDSISSDPKKGKQRLDYFTETKSNELQAPPTHLAFQEKAIPPGAAIPTLGNDNSGVAPKDLHSRKLSKTSRADRGLSSPSVSSVKEDRKHVSSSSRSEDFALQEAPKSKKTPAVGTRANSQSANSLSGAREFETPRVSKKKRTSTVSPPVSTSNSSMGGRSSQEARMAQDDDDSVDSGGLVTPTSRPSQGSEQHARNGHMHKKETSSSTRTAEGDSSSSPLGNVSSPDDNTKHSLAPPLVLRPNMAEHKLSDTYMQPRAPPRPPSTPAPLPGHFQTSSKESVVSNNAPRSDAQSPPKGPSPKLPRWSAGGDFSLEEDMARILGGADEGSSSIFRRVSNAVRHGRNSSADSSNFAHGNGMSPRGHNRSVSETTRATASPRWPKTPIAEDSGAHNISSPISLASGPSQEDPALLKRRLRNSEQRVAELERQFGAEKDLKSINKKLLEKRRTVSVLDTQAEIMIRQLEVLAGYVERAKATKQPIDVKELEDSAVKEFVQKLDELQKSMTATIEQLHTERDALVEEKNQAVADRDRALLEFEQLSSKNAQLADMNNDLTHQIQERFRSQTEHIKSPHGLGIYHSNKGPSSSSMNDAASIQTSTTATLVGTDGEEPIVESGPTVVNIRKGQVRKFNWKKGSKTVAQNLSKGVNRAVGAFQNDRDQQRGVYQGLTGDSIGLPYNMTVTSVDSPSAFGAQAVQIVGRGPGDFGSTGSGVGGPGGVGNRGGGAASGSMGPGAVYGTTGGTNNVNGGFGFFKKSNVSKSGTATSLMSSTPPAVEASATLFGSDLVERADHERRQIPSVVTRCIEEVELRGMDVEGIYRKTGGNSQVRAIQEGFEKQEDYDISDPGLDITAVTSVLKQYFRKLPNPLLTFEVYDGVLESISIFDTTERCDHLRKTLKLLPAKHHDCLEFLMFHLSRVANRERENLMSPKNLAVVFAPTILHTQNLEREMSDMHAKNLSIQFIIENSHTIFSEA